MKTVTKMFFEIKGDTSKKLEIDLRNGGSDFALIEVDNFVFSEYLVSKVIINKDNMPSSDTCLGIYISQSSLLCERRYHQDIVIEKVHDDGRLVFVKIYGAA